jgi:uncharacterized membrane protein YgaE (UPF0421/DUF939 family)
MNLYKELTISQIESVEKATRKIMKEKLFELKKKETLSEKAEIIKLKKEESKTKKGVKK